MWKCWKKECRFLLTRPLRDVTEALSGMLALINDFYSHAPYGTWPETTEHRQRPDTFLLTRPLRDVTVIYVRSVLFREFLLTRPLRDVTIWFVTFFTLAGISTHTPLTGRDRLALCFNLWPPDFYSHAPYGTWLSTFLYTVKQRSHFYSHAPYGTWRCIWNVLSDIQHFYSHAPYGTWHNRP